MSNNLPTHAEAMAELSKLLEPCFGDNPTAGAAAVIVSDTTVAYVVVNMNGLEVVHTLQTAAASIMARMSDAPSTETMQ